MIRKLGLSKEIHPLREERDYAAVAVIFGPDQEMLMIRRAEREGDPWSGHMAFPGGHRDGTDPDLIGTAIREVEEEIGMTLSRESLVGALTELSPVSRRHEIWVHPFVFAVNHWPAFSPSGEVATVHRFGFGRILQGEGRGDFPYDWQGTPYRFPCLRLDGTLIWGLSLRMIDELVERTGGLADPADGAPR